MKLSEYEALVTTEVHIKDIQPGEKFRFVENEGCGSDQYGDSVLKLIRKTNADCYFIDLTTNESNVWDIKCSCKLCHLVEKVK
jgi:hypothetical protein